MKLYNQNNYPNTPYPSPTLPAATVKSGGCGVCCASTVLSFFGVDCPPDKLAPIFIGRKIRVVGGTDMRAAARYICEAAGVACTTTSSEETLVGHLKAGGVAIANVDGDVGEKGVFSNAGHFIVVLGVKPNGDFMVFDVGDYPSKFGSAYRSALVKREGDLLVCSQDTLHIDTRHRSPNYYLFKGDENMTQQQFDKMMDDYLRRRGELPVSDWAKDELASAVSKQLTDGSRPQAFVTRQEAAIMAARAGR